MTLLEAERLALAFLLAGNTIALSAEAMRRLSAAGRVLIEVCDELPAVVCAIGIEAAVRVWRRSRMPDERDRAFPTRDHYAAVLRLARAIERTTIRELASQPWPNLLLIELEAERAA